MADELDLPDFRPGDEPADFAIRLRTRAFKLKSQAAHYAGVHNSTIGKYESGQITPPLGYIAALVQLIVAQEGAGLSAGQIVIWRDFFLLQLRKLLIASRGYYPDEDEPRSWPQLARLASSYLTRHRGLTPADPDGEPPATEAKAEVQTLWPAIIPREDFYPLAAHEQKLTVLLEKLRCYDGPRLIAITGLRGTGKRTLMAELARRVLAERICEGVIGESARMETMASTRLVRLRQTPLRWPQLLDALALQLGGAALSKLKKREKGASVRKLLRHQALLLLIDGLDEMEEPDRVITELLKLLNGGAISRIVVTSTRWVAYGADYSLALSHLGEVDALAYLRHEAQRADVTQLRDASDELLLRFAHLAGGVPLALRVAVVQASLLGLNPMLERLQAGDGLLFQHIFGPTWERLTPLARSLLAHMVKSPLGSTNWDALAASGLAANAESIMGALLELLSYSLIERVSTAVDPRYAVQPLTRQFVQSTTRKRDPAQQQISSLKAAS